MVLWASLQAFFFFFFFFFFFPLGGGALYACKDFEVGG